MAAGAPGLTAAAAVVAVALALALAAAAAAGATMVPAWGGDVWWQRGSSDGGAAPGLVADMVSSGSMLAGRGDSPS
jgi:Spy/CpxP family protein refolding chaperone